MKNILRKSRGSPVQLSEFAVFNPFAERFLKFLSLHYFIRMFVCILSQEQKFYQSRY
ncbi:hypothetical protein AB434_3042 [Heyndrickxia coagulans]|uniref:Uncharacterized protein n=1 Tax=Heyndrickxia coagulans TaxID=1398 RepID=A0AAN0T6T6_HEYCO|nr:hypothetical protein SB48_HM08orf03558 [Heyndrickxia coagulans]AKN55447.1 hypothetical protein AB434_3042 [Heyndrickxia coagulans]KYC88544.1 hypothetical protein B4096_3342 [Heyndrickxia coagulans]